MQQEEGARHLAKDSLLRYWRPFLAVVALPGSECAVDTQRDGHTASAVGDTGRRRTGELRFTSD